MSEDIFIVSDGFIGTHRAMIVGYLQSNGAPDVEQKQIVHATDKPFVIVKCINQSQYDRVAAACCRDFNRVEANGLHPFPVRTRRFVERGAK